MGLVSDGQEEPLGPFWAHLLVHATGLPDRPGGSRPRLLCMKLARPCRDIYQRRNDMDSSMLRMRSHCSFCAKQPVSVHGAARDARNGMR
jgi:hypothetical protein